MDTKKSCKTKYSPDPTPLAQITALLIDAQGVQDTLERIGDILSTILHARRWSIMMKTELNVLRIKLANGLPENIIEHTRVKLGEGIAGKIVQEGRGGLFSNIAQEFGMASGGNYASTSAICIPIAIKGQVLGILNINDKSLDGRTIISFDEQDLSLAYIIANQAAVMLKMAHSIERIRQKTSNPELLQSPDQQNNTIQTQASAFDLLSRVIDLMTVNANLDQVLSSVIEGTSHLLGATRISLMLLDKDSDELHIRAAVGMDQEIAAKVRVPLGVGIAGRVAETGIPQILRNARETRIGDKQKRDPEERHYQVNSALSVPLKIQGNVIGVLNINDPYDRNDFTDNDLSIARIIASQAAVAIATARLLEESVSAAEMRRSMAVANEIQNHLLPVQLEIEGIEISGRSDTCEAAGGDYIDFFAAKDISDPGGGGIYLCCGDVSGHGVGAALIMAMGRAFLRALLQQDNTLDTVMSLLNNLIEADTPHEQFMTLFLGLINRDNGLLTYSSAGHEPGLLYRSATDEIIELQATGLPLGMFSDQNYSASTLSIHKNDLLILSTDGLTEAMDSQEQYYGRQRLINDIRQCAHLSPADLITELKRRVVAFIHPQPFRDDLSLIVAKILISPH